MAKRRTTRKRFPLWLHHASGQWCKKIDGKRFYFGLDKEKALERYEHDRNALEKGEDPVSDDFTVRELVNAFLTHKRRKVTEGDLNLRSWSEYHAICERIVKTLGKDKPVARLRPNDFGKLRDAAAEKLGRKTLAKFITLTQAVFTYAFKNEHISRPVSYGTQFDKPKKRDDEKKDRTIAAGDVWKLLDNAEPQMRAMILLGLNAAYGQTDSANLTRAMLDTRPGWLSADRSKTGAGRKCPLWPETIEALAAVAPVRPQAKDKADSGHVFITAHGNRWVRYLDRGNVDKGQPRRGLALDAVALEFKKLCKRAGVKPPGGPYCLRHTFATTGSNAKDRDALKVIMGHKDSTITDGYIHEFDEARLIAVTDCVRAWLMAGKPDVKSRAGTPDILQFKDAG
jgi:integrase